MGQASSRQTKDLVPSSRKTKELGRPKADSVSCQTKAKSKTPQAHTACLSNSSAYLYCDKFEGTY